MEQMDDDIQLIARFRSGDESAFDALLERYQRRVYATAYRMTNDLEEAKDVTQKVFLNAYQGLPGFRQDASFKTWLYQICVNVCLNHVRQRRGIEVELDESTQTYQAQLSFTLVDPATGAAIGAVTVGVNAETF